MSRKSLIICICAAVIFLGLIGLGMMKLYNGKPASADTEEVSHAVVLRAVPSDAAAVFCFQNSKDGVKLFSDASRCFGTLLSGNPSFRDFISQLLASGDMKSVPMALSLHFAGVLEPLMALECGHQSADTTGFQKAVLDMAEEFGLQGRVACSGDGNYLLVSGSETIADASQRHLESGVSLLDDTDFGKAAARMPYKNVFFVSNGYAAKLTSPFLQSKYGRRCAFLKTVADWTAFSIDDYSAKQLTMTGQAVYGANPSYYFRLLDDVPAGDICLPDIAPAGTVFALSLAVPDQGAWHKAYSDYLDASMKLQRYKAGCDTLFARTGIDPVKWASSNSVREVATLYWKSADGQGRNANCIRFSKSSGEGTEPYANEMPGVAALLYGDIFAIEDESYAARFGEWLICGSHEAVTEVLSAGSRLKDKFDEYGRTVVPEKSTRFTAYFSACDARPDFGRIFKSSLSEDLDAAVSGSLWAPVVMSYTKDGLCLQSSRVIDAAYAKEKARKKETAGRYAKVEVPSGPFQVTNCATGKTNLFYQSDNLYLCLKDEESGKGLWGVPFDAPICGMVECIDYLANGKLQFLFAAGSRLYLIDRLGRFVSGFPVELGKEVLIGPSVYDFSGAKGYTVLTLHKDNSIEMYDIHGKKPERWLGITNESTIMDLPVLATADDRKCWVVRTASGDAVYDFWGGEPLKKKEIKNLQY